MKRILVKAPNWVGDCVMATPALAYLREALPDSQIDVLARPSVAGVLAGNQHATSILAVDDRKPDHRHIEQIHATGYDAVALFTNSLGSAWLASRLGIPHRVGFARGGRGLLLSHGIPYRREEWQTRTPGPLSPKSLYGSRDALPQSRHMVHYYLTVAAATLEAMEVPAPEFPAEPKLHLTVPDGARAAVDELMPEAGAGKPLLIGINPGAAYGNAKRWPLEYLAAAAGKLVDETPGVVVSTASVKERHLNDEVERLLPHPLLRWGERLDLPGLAALLERLDVLITNDSGAMHMAAAVGTPTIAVFGPTDWAVTRPWSERAQVVRNSPACAPCFLRECPIDHRCMRLITSEMVADAARNLLNDKAHARP